MKITALIVVFVFVAILGVAIVRKANAPLLSQNQPTIQTPTPHPAPTRTLTTTVTVGEETLGYHIFFAAPDAIVLIANFEKKHDSQTVFKTNECTSGSSGGFYDVNNNPLGYFSVNDQTIGEPVRSSLVNGYFSVGKDGRPRITPDLPTETRIALQTGPQLFADGRPLPLSIRNDEHARRLAVAIDTNGNVFFIVLFNPQSVFDGPFLESLPSFIQAVAQNEKLSLLSAINLDGGSASAYYSQDATLSELTPVGSFFCVRS